MTTPAQRTDAFLLSIDYRKNVYPNYAQDRVSCVDPETYLRRFNEDFFRKSEDPDSIEKKELKDYWRFDRNRTDRDIEFNDWLPIFQRIIVQAMPTSLHR